MHGAQCDLCPEGSLGNQSPKVQSPQGPSPPRYKGPQGSLPCQHPDLPHILFTFKTWTPIYETEIPVSSSRPPSHTSLYLSPPLSTSLSNSSLLHIENQSSCYCNAHHHGSSYCIFSQNGYSFSINSSQVPHRALFLPHRRRSHAPHPVASVTLYNYSSGRQPEVITFHTRALKPNRRPASVPQVSLRRKPVSTPRSVERQVKTLSAELAQVQHRSLYCHPQEGTRAWSV